jgi:hypothetical protein
MKYPVNWCEGENFGRNYEALSRAEESRYDAHKYPTIALIAAEYLIVIAVAIVLGRIFTDFFSLRFNTIYWTTFFVSVWLLIDCDSSNPGDQDNSIQYTLVPLMLATATLLLPFFSYRTASLRERLIRLLYGGFGACLLLASALQLTRRIYRGYHFF